MLHASKQNTTTRHYTRNYSPCRLTHLDLGKADREGIFNLRTISERFLKKQKYLCICFIDYEKAFDRVCHEKLIEKLKLAGLDWKYVRTIDRIYWGQAAVVRTVKRKPWRSTHKKRDKTGICTFAVSLHPFY